MDNSRGDVTPDSYFLIIQMTETKTCIESPLDTTNLLPTGFLSTGPLDIPLESNLVRMKNAFFVSFVNVIIEINP